MPVNQIRVALLSLAIVGFVITSAASQTARRGLVRWDVTIANAQALTPVPRAYRVFETTRELVLTFAVSNGSQEPVLLDAPQFRAGIHVEVSGPPAVAVAIEWQPAVRRSGESVSTAVGAGEAIRLDAGSGLSWDVILRRADGEPFTYGNYVILVNVAKALPAIQSLTSGTQALRGPAETHLELAIERPATSAQQAAMYRHQAETAMTQGRAAEAVQAFARGLAATPNDVDLLAGMGHAYMALDRYQEAIAVYERALPVLRGRSGLPLALAQAYLAIGDETNAARVLRLAGKRENQIAAEMTTLREALRRRRNR